MPFTWALSTFMSWLGAPLNRNTVAKTSDIPTMAKRKEEKNLRLTRPGRLRVEPNKPANTCLQWDSAAVNYYSVALAGGAHCCHLECQKSMGRMNLKRTSSKKDERNLHCRTDIFILPDTLLFLMLFLLSSAHCLLAFSSFSFTVFVVVLVCRSAFMLFSWAARVFRFLLWLANSQ